MPQLSRRTSPWPGWLALMLLATAAIADVFGGIWPVLLRFVLTLAVIGGVGALGVLIWGLLYGVLGSTRRE